MKQNVKYFWHLSFLTFFFFTNTRYACEQWSANCWIKFCSETLCNGGNYGTAYSFKTLYNKLLRFGRTNNNVIIVSHERTRPVFPFWSCPFIRQSPDRTNSDRVHEFFRASSEPNSRALFTTRTYKSMACRIRVITQVNETVRGPRQGTVIIFWEGVYYFWPFHLQKYLIFILYSNLVICNKYLLKWVYCSIRVVTIN